MINIEVKKVKLSAIRENPDNPRLIRDGRYEKLKQSLKDFPEMMSIREIVVDETMMILGGNMRFRALKELKEKIAIVKIAGVIVTGRHLCKEMRGVKKRGAMTTSALRGIFLIGEVKQEFLKL